MESVDKLSPEGIPGYEVGAKKYLQGRNQTQIYVPIMSKLILKVLLVLEVYPLKLAYTFDSDSYIPISKERDYSTTMFVLD